MNEGSSGLCDARESGSMAKVLYPVYDSAAYMQCNVIVHTHFIAQAGAR